MVSLQRAGSLGVVERKDGAKPNLDKIEKLLFRLTLSDLFLPLRLVPASSPTEKNRGLKACGGRKGVAEITGFLLFAELGLNSVVDFH